jgi:hypothetical protein
MPIDPRNSCFAQGLGRYYRVHGRHSLRSQVTYVFGGKRLKTFKPVKGGRILQLDDPSFDMQAGRPGSACDTGHLAYHYHTDTNGTDIGLNGALLECRNVHIPRSSVLLYSYVFLPFETSTNVLFRSFALFVAYEQSSVDAQGGRFQDVKKPYAIQQLGNSGEMPDHLRPQLEWRLGSWQPTEDFTGTLCWLSSTGRDFGKDTDGECIPSMLLLKSIEIRPIQRFWHGRGKSRR